MKLNDQQIAGFVAQGGFTGDDQATAIAIVLAESAGVTDILGDTTIETDVFGPSVGLFQIRSIKTERGTGGERDELANTADLYIKLRRQAGDSMTLDVLRDGKRIRMPLHTHSLSFRK